MDHDDTGFQEDKLTAVRERWTRARRLRLLECSVEHG